MEVLVGLICTISFALLSAQIMFYMLCDVQDQLNKASKKVHKSKVYKASENYYISSVK